MQFVVMMVPAYMQVPIPIGYNADGIVGIGSFSFVLCGLNGPCCRAEGSFTNYQPLGRVVISNVLDFVKGGKGIVPEYNGVYRVGSPSITSHCTTYIFLSQGSTGYDKQ